jgi:hypothetical protein
LDTPEEAKYRAEVRAKLEKERQDQEKADRLKKIEEEEKARAAKGTPGQQIATGVKKGLKELFS